MVVAVAVAIARTHAQSRHSHVKPQGYTLHGQSVRQLSVTLLTHTPWSSLRGCKLRSCMRGRLMGSLVRLYSSATSGASVHHSCSV